MSRNPLQSAQVLAVPVVPVLLWCVLAGTSTALLLLVPAFGRSAREYGGTAGPLRLLTDLLLFSCLFILPIWRRGRGEATSHSLVVVVFTGIVGVLTFSHLAGTPTEDVVRLVGFITLISLAADLCASALCGHRGVYYAVAAMMCFGAPLVRFFCQELFGIRARWVNVLSPFAAYRIALQPEDGALWPAWVVFGVLAGLGGVVAMLSARRARA